MVTISFLPSDVPYALDEIARIDAHLVAIDEQVVFFQELLNGRPARMMYSAQEIAEKPYLSDENQVLIPALIGALDRDGSYKHVLFSTLLQSTVDKYEAEHRLLDGTYPDFTVPPPYGPGSGNFDENLIQTSGIYRTLPLFDPEVSAVDPVNPGQMFGGLAHDPVNEVDKIDDELAQITILQSGLCQFVPPPIPPPPPWPLACQTALAALISSLQTRFDPGPVTGLLVQEEAALNANPDLPLFISNPLVAVAAEKSRIQLFLSNLGALPPLTPIPVVLLTANAAAATARKAYIQGTRVPEMYSFLNTNPGYYGTRFAVVEQRISGGGTAQEVYFLQKSISDAAVEKADLQVQKAFIESLLP